MARKRKLQTKAQRIKEVGAEIEAFIEEQGEATKLQNYGDEHLFAIDTAGSTSKKAKLTKDPAVWSGKYKPEKAKALKKTIDRIQAKPAVAVVKAVEVAADGQSYHPEVSAHQAVLAEALAKVAEKQKQREKDLAPLVTGISNNYIMESSIKAKEKLTRSDRNRQARHKALEKELDSRRTNKKLLGQINKYAFAVVKTLESGVKKDEKVYQKKKQLKVLLKAQKLDDEPEVMIAGKKRWGGRPTFIVVRPTLVSTAAELSGNIRSLKGSAMKDRYDSLLKRNKIEIGKTTRNRTKWTKFVPRHKYRDDFTNFTHRHARKTVEISFEEYTHNKNEILGKIYRRLFWLACLATTFGLIELVVYIVRCHFRRPVLGVALKSVYLVYWGMSADDDSNESHGDAEVLRGPAAVQFTIDPKKTLQKSAFWDLWKSTEVAGSFSCTFHNKPPTLTEVTKHLNARGFHVVSSNTSKDVVEVFLYAHSQADDNLPFLAEFIFVYPRRYFQTTFKCASKDVAGEFVKQFQLHQLMDTDD
ncbi:hypothetical protein DYB25_004431 [Aphanomyces astaci]|uniref:Ribosome biogenesis protein NOP53 n=1 Tax=Aphanomyces astaci TaxID=112090 RepID=A0A397AZT6_APHAT|nr:hypothetical protein DYB25_004431 [Aphanomyces astaci]